MTQSGVSQVKDSNAEEVGVHERRALDLIEQKDFNTLIGEINDFPDGSLSSKVADLMHVHLGMMTVQANRAKFNFPTPWPSI